MRFERDVVPGVHRLAHANVNAYLIESDTGLTLVDAGLPRLWPHLTAALHSMGRGLPDLVAVVLTHAHFDHVGVAERLRTQTGIPVLVHGADAELAAHPFTYRRESNPLTYPLRHPRGVPGLLSMVAAGAATVRGVAQVQTMTDRQQLPVPGAPVVLHTPGHTDGSCALHLSDRGVVLTGDALVTRDPYTARTGPQIVSGAATASSEQALASLDLIEATDAPVVLPGHGEPWHRGATAAVTQARRRHRQ